MLVDAYAAVVHGAITQLLAHEANSLEQAAELLAQSIIAGGVVHVFGSGHSSSVAKEATGRAGALVPMNQIIDHSQDSAERVPGYAGAVLDAYERQFGLESGETLIVVSNSGVNPLPVELAESARERGLKTVGIVNVAHCNSTVSRSSGGKTLLDVVDIVIDTHGSIGDSAVSLPNGTPVGPTSTVIGSFALNALVLLTIERLQEAGTTVPILLSENLPDRPADEHNARLREMYRGRLRYPGG